MSRKVFAFVLFLLVAGAVWAQSVAGMAGISGVVRDPSGAVVPGAKVIVSTEGQGVIRTLSTNEAGVFAAPALTPAAGYKISVTAQGFMGYEARNIELQVGQNLALEITVKLAAASAAVEVIAAAPLIEEAKTDVSGVVDSKSITDLPINGRRVDSFVLLQPGVTNDGTYGLLTFRGVAAGNAFLVDGNDSTQQYYNENAGRTRIASQISQDSVQEFQVVAANFSAEYGRAMGGVINTITKSGTNDFHGGAFWFFRNRTLNARDPFANYNPPEWRHQAGGTFGGPIKKDKLFFFLATEITRRNFPLVGSLIRAGVIDSNNQTWIGCGAPATPAQCAAINTLLPRFFGTIPRTLAQDIGFGKIDYRMNERNTFTAGLNYQHMVSPNGIQTGATVTTGGQITSNGDDSVRVRNGKFGWIAVPTNSFVNEFRFGWATDRQADTFDDALLGPNLGYLAVTVNGQAIGSTNYLPRVEPDEQRFQFADNATWTKSKHIFKFGFDTASAHDIDYYISNANGSYTYQTVTNFALDYSSAGLAGSNAGKHWQSYAQTFGTPSAEFTIRDYALYAQDQWRVTNRLNLNVGARWEYNHLPQPTLINKDYPQTGVIHSTANNVAPRVGITYRLNDKTVIQAGYGISYARFAGGTLSNLFKNNAVYQTAMSLSSSQPAQLAAGPMYPNILGAAPAGASVSSTYLQFAAPNLKTPYAEQGNVGVQRQIGSDISMNVSYIWSRGVQLGATRDLNFYNVGPTVTYTIVDANNNPTGTWSTPVYIGSRPDPRYNGIYQLENGVNSYYNALAVQARRRFTHGFTGQLSYTWAHEIDDGQSYGGSTNNLFFTSNTYWLYNGNYNADKSSGALDQRHRFVLSWVWEPKFTTRTGGFYKYVVNNWQLTSLTTLASGRPYSVQVNVTDTPVTGMANRGSLNGAGLSYRVPFWPYYSQYYPARYNSDASLAKIIPLNEKGMKLQLKFEIFNLANSWSATSNSSSQAFQEKGMIISPTPLYGQPSADAGFPDGTQARRMQVSLRFLF
ncbi:MAG TPA: TonB-dependent receptor [Candidatus Acidoferrales bacterium]|nr:TonB-dependent receptor [Candidatus Acidoferrales bacterium]